MNTFVTDLDHRPTSQPMRTLDGAFDLALMEGEEVLFEGRPDEGRLFRYFMIISLLTIGGLALAPLLYFVFGAYVRKHRYWLTTSRVIVTYGVIGYRARSIPLERVSDVAISCNWLERWMGLRSVIVRDMTGEAMSGAPMFAVADASALQRHILDRVQDANRGLSLSPAQSRDTRPYRGSEEDRKGAEMLELLRKIEANTRTD